MDPLAIGGFILQGGLSILGGDAAAQAARRMAAIRASILEMNAKALDYSAADALARGSFSESMARVQGGQKVGQQTTAFANSGVDVQSGSAQDTYAATDLTTELNARIIQSNARREAWGYTTKAQQTRLAARLALEGGEAQANEAMLGGVIGVAQAGIPLLRIGGGGGDSGAPSRPGINDFNDQGL